MERQADDPEGAPRAEEVPWRVKHVHECSRCGKVFECFKALRWHFGPPVCLDCWYGKEEGGGG